MPVPQKSDLSGPHYPSRATIDGYGGGSFRFAGVQHKGSLLILPSGMRGWRPESLSDVHTADLHAILAERSEIALLLFGAGATMALLPGSLRSLITAASITLEMMDTGAAVRTYNILMAEKRAVAAALLAVP